MASEIGVLLFCYYAGLSFKINKQKFSCWVMSNSVIPWTAGAFFTAGPPGKPQDLYGIRKNSWYKNAHLLICGHKVSFWKLLYEDIEDLVVKWWTSTELLQVSTRWCKKGIIKVGKTHHTQSALRSQNSSHDAARQILLSLHQQHSIVCCVTALTQIWK